jgi:hypothetical protein
MSAPQTVAPAAGKAPLAFPFGLISAELQYLDRALSAMGVAVDAAWPILTKADEPCIADALKACLRACCNELGAVEDVIRLLEGSGKLATPPAKPTT